MALYYSSRVFRSSDPEFISKLSEWYLARKELLKIPIFNHQEFDLAKLWHAVRELGGSEKVCQMKRWASIGRLFNPPASMTNLSFHMKRLWFKYLLDYERELYQVGAMQVDESEYSSSRPKMRSKRSDDQLLESLSRIHNKRPRPEDPPTGVTPGAVEVSRMTREDIIQEASAEAGIPRRCLTSCKVHLGEQTTAQQAHVAAMAPQPQALYLAAGQPQGKDFQPQQQVAVQQCGNILLVLPASVPERMATGEQAAAVAATNAEHQDGHRGGDGQIAIAKNEGGLVLPIQLTADQVAHHSRHHLREQEQPATPSSVSRVNGFERYQQVQPPSASPDDAMAHVTALQELPKPATASTPEDIQIICLEEYYRQRIECLESRREEELKDVKGTIDRLEGRIRELEGNLASTASVAEETQLYLETLLQVAQPNAGAVGPLVKKLFSVHCHRQPSNGMSDVAPPQGRGVLKPN
eukprot:evm.model.scf_1224.5 EVM.evm.TU.scf_1224.5   scf_1224:42116-47812(-)